MPIIAIYIRETNQKIKKKLIKKKKAKKINILMSFKILFFFFPICIYIRFCNSIISSIKIIIQERWTFVLLSKIEG